jgi:iron complex outermembrane receptor protein
VRYDFNGLFKPAAAVTADSYVNGSLDLNYDVDGDWSIELLADAGVDNSLIETYGGVNIGLATLALNGTTQSNGSTTATSLPGYTATTLNLPLTTANALDVWDPVSTNKTSATTLASLINNKSMSSYFYSVEQFRLSAQGSLFKLPAGDLKLAVGVEVYNQSTWQNVVTPENNAGANVASAYTNLNLHRGDLAEYAELDIPVVSTEMNVPFVQKLELDLAARHDAYTDFGSTTNPKIGLTWTVNDDLSFRANASTGFVAPQLSLTGAGNGQAGFSTAGAVTLSLALPLSLYPLLPQEGIPGCTASSITCPINTLTGGVVHTGEAPAVAMTGRSWNLGADMHPSWFPGFYADLTYWHTSLAKGTNSPSFNLSVNTPALAGRIVLTPTCATPAQLYTFTLNGALPLATPFPPCVQYLEYQDANAYVTFQVDGLDAEAGYRYETDFGTLSVDDSLSQALRFDEGFCKACKATVLFNVLNTDGVNALDPSIGIQNRMDLGWAMNGIRADLFVNWTSGYRDVASPVNPIMTDSVGRLVGGGDHVNAYVQYDAHLSYSFDTSWTGADMIGLTVKNVFNSPPPYWNATTGYDPVVANPLGRTFTLNLTAKF